MKRKKLQIHPMALLFYLGMILSDRSGLGIATLAAALLHELGHFLAAMWLHIPLSGFKLDLLGARIEVGEKYLSYGEEWLLASAGPLISLTASILAAPFWSTSRLSIMFSCASLLLGILNLLPIRTFDGGRMLEATLLSFSNPTVTNRVMSASSFTLLFFLWSGAVYFLLRAGDGLSLWCFSMSLLSRFFRQEQSI